MKFRTYCRRVSLALLAVTTTMYPTQALADPFSIGSAIVGSIIGALPAGSAAAFALTAAAGSASFLTGVGVSVLAGASLALSFLGGQQPGSINPGKAKEEIASQETSEIQAVGTVRLGGAVAYGNNDHPNMFRLLLHCKGPVNAILKTYVNGREVVVDEDDRVLSSPFSKVSSSGGTIEDTWLYVYSEFGDGTETAWTRLKNAFPDIWTDDHRVRGIFQTLIRARNPGTSTNRYRQIYGAAAYPKVDHLVQTALIYDPRKDDTVTGGSGAHRADDASTWEFTDNGPLGAMHILLQYPDIAHTDIDWEEMTSSADAADVLVSTKSGTEKRSRISGVWPSMNNRGDTMQQALDSIGGEIRITSEGKIYIALIDDNPAAELSFTEDEIKVLNWQSGPEAVERPNTCRVRYYSPERDYEMAEINMAGIGWANIADEVARWGEKTLDVDLPFCFSASQAQRIARRLFMRARADRGEIVTNMYGLAAWGCHYVDLPFFGDIERCAIAGPRIDDEAGEVTIPFVQLPTLAVWNTSTDEADPPTTKSPQLDDTELETPGQITSAFWVRYEGGTKEVRCTFDDDVSGSNGYLCVYEPFVGEFPQRGGVLQEFPNDVNVARVQTDLEGEKVQFRHQAYDSDTSSEFSDPLIIEALAENSDAALGVVGEVSNQAGSAPGPYNYTVSGTIETPNIVKLRVTLVNINGTITHDLINGDAGPGDYSYFYSSSTNFAVVQWRQTVSGGDETVEQFPL